jgi:hypothetical protein
LDEDVVQDDNTGWVSHQAAAAAVRVGPALILYCLLKLVLTSQLVCMVENLPWGQQSAMDSPPTLLRLASLVGSGHFLYDTGHTAGE